MEEKVMLKREGMVLERWQKHLDEWDKVKKKVSKKRQLPGVVLLLATWVDISSNKSIPIYMKYTAWH